MTPNKYALREDTVLCSPDFTYTIEKVLGQGGFGITYLATAEVMVGNIPQEFRFAIKEHFVSQLCERDSRTLRVEYSDPVSDMVNKSRRDFLREARRLQQLGIHHPNVVRINEVFETNNTAYYVMEYLGDVTLQKYVADKGRLTMDETKAILGPVIDAVAMIHDNRLAHYDIKPGNIMLQSKRGRLERPVLIDFGLAKHYDENGNATSTLGAGGYSAGYAPIEQTQGIREFSPRCDVYALAATAYYCLTGQRPPEAIKARKEGLMTELTAVTDIHTANAIVHGMAMLDDNRTPDARSLANELFDIVSNATRPIKMPVYDEPTIAPDIVEIDLDSRPSQPKPQTPSVPYSRPKSRPKLPDPRVPMRKKSNRGIIILLGVISLIALAYVIANFNRNEDSASPQTKTAEETPATVEDNNENKYKAAVDYLDKTTQWKKTEMEEIPGLKGLYEALNTYQLDTVENRINKLGGLDTLSKNGQVAVLMKNIERCKNFTRKPQRGFYSDDGMITLTSFFNDLIKRNETRTRR